MLPCKGSSSSTVIPFDVFDKGDGGAIESVTTIAWINGNTSLIGEIFGIVRTVDCLRSVDRVRTVDKVRTVDQILDHSSYFVHRS